MTRLIVPDGAGAVDLPTLGIGGAEPGSVIDVDDSAADALIAQGWTAAPPKKAAKPGADSPTPAKE